MLDDKRTSRWKHTVNVALTLIGLRHEEVGDVSADVIFITDGITTEYLL